MNNSLYYFLKTVLVVICGVWKYVLSFPHIGKIAFLGTIFAVGNLFSPFNTVKISSHFLLACEVSSNKSEIRLIGISLSVVCFSPAALKFLFILDVVNLDYNLPYSKLG